MRVTVILIVIEAFVKVSKNLEKRLDELEIRKIEAIQTTALLRLSRILRRVLDI